MQVLDRPEIERNLHDLRCKAEARECPGYGYGFKRVVGAAFGRSVDDRNEVPMRRESSSSDDGFVPLPLIRLTISRFALSYSDTRRFYKRVCYVPSHPKIKRPCCDTLISARGGPILGRPALG